MSYLTRGIYKKIEIDPDIGNLRDFLLDKGVRNSDIFGLEMGIEIIAEKRGCSAKDIDIKTLFRDIISGFLYFEKELKEEE